MAICPKCSSDNAPDKKFCTQCGGPLDAAAPAQAAPGDPAPEIKTGIPAPPVNPFRQAAPVKKKPRRTAEPKPQVRPESAPNLIPMPLADLSQDANSSQTDGGATEKTSESQAVSDNKNKYSTQTAGVQERPPMFRPEERAEKSQAPLEPSFSISQEAGPGAAPVFEDTDPGDPGSYERSRPEDLFQRKPWLARVLGFGAIALFLLPAVIAIIANARRNPDSSALPAPALTQAADKAPADCVMKAEKAVGDVRVQPRPGMSFRPLAPGDCAEPGAALTTGAGGRLELRVKDPALTLYVNARTDLFLNPVPEGSTRAPSLLRVQQGELWLSTTASDTVRLAMPLGVVDTAATGEFHFMARENRTYVTAATGSLSVTTATETIPVAAGFQLILGQGGEIVSHQAIERDKFLRWAGAWKDTMDKPLVALKPASGSSPATAAPGQSATQTQKLTPAQEKQFIVDTVLDAPPGALPPFVTAHVMKHNDRWAIAITRDGRADGASQPDYWPQTGVLLAKDESDRWKALEFFDDYSQEKFLDWNHFYGFTKKDAEALGLKY